MSRDRFDVLERFASMFDPSEPSFEGFLRRRDRKRRNQRISAGVVAIAVFVAAVWIVTTGGPFHRTQMPAAPGPTVLPTPRLGLIGLPPKGATPSTPKRGELVFSFLFGHTMGDAGRFSVFVYADGRLIWQRLADFTRGGDEHGSDDTTGLLEQHLTPEGVELMRAEVNSTGLFDHDLYLDSAYGLNFGQIEVRNADRPVRVTWGDCCDPGQEDLARTMQTPEQARALQRLDARLADPASWLPASAWEGPGDRAIRAIGVLGLQPGAPADGTVPDPDPVPGCGRGLAPHPEHEAGAIHQSPGHLRPLVPDLRTEEARALDQILDSAGQERHEDRFGLQYVVRGRDPGATEVSLSIEPLLPHQM